MADNMLRIAGRETVSGTAKAVRADVAGNLGVTFADSEIALPVDLQYSSIGSPLPTSAYQINYLGVDTLVAGLVHGTGHGGGLAYDSNDTIYVLFGNSTARLKKYVISTGVLTNLTDAPAVVGAGGTMTYANGNLYVVHGTDLVFWRYNITANTWTELANVPEIPAYGARLIFAGGRDLYLLRGRASTAMYKYDIIAATWATMAVLPDTPGEPAAAYAGGDTIYVWNGTQTTYKLYSYNIQTNAWASTLNAPTSFSDNIANTPSLVCHGDYLYLWGFDTYHSVWRYSIVDNRWKRIGRTVAVGGQGSHAISTATHIYLIQGGNTSSLYGASFVDETHASYPTWMR